MVKLSELSLGLCKCLWQLPKVLTSVWKQTPSQETATLFGEAKTPTRPRKICAKKKALEK